MELLQQMQEIYDYTIQGGEEMKVYISGKMGEIPEGRITKRFQEAADYLRKEGFVAVNPAVMLNNPGLEYDDCMKIALKMLSVCDAIYLLRGWQDSPGSKEELKFAIATDKKIILEE